MLRSRQRQERDDEPHQSGGHVAPSVDLTRLAVAILAALRGGLTPSQPERASWPLEAALDSAFAALRATATSPA